MVRRFFFLCLLVTHALIGFGQLKETVFVGSASVGRNVSYTYKLCISDSNGIITGYSITDLMGPNETKTSVKGTINWEKKTIDFRETKLLYTKSKEDKSQFCYLNAHVKMIKKQKALCLKGSFTGYDERKAECAKGSLMLISAQDLLAKLTKMAGTRDTSKDPVLNAEQVAEKKQQLMGQATTPAQLQNVIAIEPGKSLDVLCGSNKVKLSIWDDKINDGDVITLLHNGQVILDNYRITGKRKELEIELSATGNNVLKIVAINEGSEPLNTARIKITSGDEVTYVDATTTINNSVRIVLKRK